MKRAPVDKTKREELNYCQSPWPGFDPDRWYFICFRFLSGYKFIKKITAFLFISKRESLYHNKINVDTLFGFRPKYQC
jgi:hypothetical protein